MAELLRNILVEVGVLIGGMIINFSPYWSKSLFDNATQQQAETDSKLPLDIKERQKYVVRMLMKGGLLFYIIVLIFLVRDIWRLLQVLLLQV